METLSKEPIEGKGIGLMNATTNNAKTLHGLPEEVIYCKKCVMSNQRPSTSPEHMKKDTKVPTAGFTEDGICHACVYNEYKHNGIDWADRERQLVDMLDRFRRKPGETRYDVLVPGSGGKDSIWVSHLLKYKYGMNPLTVTWAPHTYTDIGWKNFQAWIHSGFDNMLYTPNGKVHSQLTKAAFMNLCNPFQPFIMGQKLAMIRFAKKFGINLVMYGENQAEYHNKLEDTESPLMKPDFYSRKSVDVNSLRFGGMDPTELKSEFGINSEDLIPYIPFEESELADANIEVHFTSFYKKWIPQEAYFYAAKHAGFEANPRGRSEGTYTKYASLDDKIDGINYYTMWIKFGQGRATSDAAHEVRDGHIDRDEAVALVRKYDGEFPSLYFQDFLKYIGISEEQFHAVVDKNRSPHLWEKVNGEWKLKHWVS